MIKHHAIIKKHNISMKNSVQSLIEYFGSLSRLAESLHVSPQSIYQWIQKGQIPPYRALQIEKVTEGKFSSVEIHDNWKNYTLHKVKK